MKILKYLLIILLIGGVLFAITFFLKTNQKSVVTYETQTPIYTTIELKTVATGKVIPEDEVEIKPQISGILEKLYVEEGDNVKTGDLLATIKVVPNEQTLNSAKGRLQNAKAVYDNAKIELSRTEELYKSEIVSLRELQNAQLNSNRAKIDVENAKADLQIIRLGSVGGAASANTNIRATVAGTILQIPVKEGDQVIESNTFNNGTTIAIIADLSKMIFEGKVDESEVGKLEIEMPLTVTLGAIQDQEFIAKLKFIAPKGNEEQGTVKFKIEGDLELDENAKIRAGYSANAALVLEKKDSVLAISEALLRFNKETQEPYVEILVEEGTYEKKELELGISDGINVEILSGVDPKDQIKIWNKTEKKKIVKEEDKEEEESENE